MSWSLVLTYIFGLILNESFIVLCMQSHQTVLYIFDYAIVKIPKQDEGIWQIWWYMGQATIWLAYS